MILRYPIPARFRLLGFTLLELMVVIVLIGILTAAILPSMRGTFEAELLHTQSRRFVGALDLAYSRAVTLNQPHRLRLDLQEHRFVVEGRTLSPGGGAEFAPVPYSPGSEGEIDPRIAVDLQPLGSIGEAEPSQAESPAVAETGAPVALDKPVTFYPDGTADPAQIVLQDRQGFRQALRINPVTGRVEIRELPRL